MVVPNSNSFPQINTLLRVLPLSDSSGDPATNINITYMVVVAYGEDPSQFVRVTYPEGDCRPCRCAVIIHGGFWKAQYGIDSAAIESLAPFFVSKGYVAMEVEYRRVGNGGGWPHTNQDIAAALAVLSGPALSGGDGGTGSSCGWVDKDKVVVVGHSAGGQLALWVCAEMCARAAAADARAVGAALRPALCVALSPVGDLTEAVTRRLSDSGDAVQMYMGSDDPSDARYKDADPAQRLPLPMPTLIVAGASDEDVPPDYVDAFYHKCASARSAVPADAPTSPLAMLVVKDCDHYAMVNAGSAGWGEIFASLDAMLVA